jgi:uncharacterized membrane protein YcfT
MDQHSPATHRVDWVDYAKGICIIWVVMIYATDYVKEITHSIGWMQHVVNFGQPFRMPDFFLLSGLFVSRVLDRPWRAYIDSKVLHFLYFYLLWSALKFVNMHWRDFAGPDPLALLWDYLHVLFEPPTGPLWFIYILALFFLAVRLLRHVPAPIVMAVAVGLQLAVTWNDAYWSVRYADKFARYFVFFYTGYLLSGWIFQAASWARANPTCALGLFVGWAIVNQILVSLHLTFLPGMQLVLGFAGASGVMLAATMLARRSLTGWLRYLGQHSIVVYLGFVIPLGFMRKVINQPHTTLDLGTLSLLVMVASIIGALLLYWTVRHTPLRFLFERPAWTSLRARPLVPLNNPPTA